MRAAGHHQRPVVVTAQAFHLVDKDGKRRAIPRISPEGTVALGVMDLQGNVRTTVGVLPDGMPAAAMKDKDGNTIWAAP